MPLTWTHTPTARAHSINQDKIEESLAALPVYLSGCKSLLVVAGATYTLTYDVWATPIHNTAGNAYCTSTDSNGLMAIAEGAVQMGCGTPDGSCAHGEVLFCPEVDGGWTTVTGTYTATSAQTTFRLHGGTSTAERLVHWVALPNLFVARLQTLRAEYAFQQGWP